MEQDQPSSQVSSESRDVVRATIVRLLATEGSSLVGDPRRVEAFLRDLCGEHPAEISVAVSALRDGIAEDLGPGAALRSQPVPLLLPRLAARLNERRGISEPLARWAVGTWALALGAADEVLVQRLDSQPGHDAASARSGSAVQGAGSWLPAGETEPVGQEVTVDAATAGEASGAASGVTPTSEWPEGARARGGNALPGPRRRSAILGAGAVVLAVVVVAAVVSGVVITRSSSSGRNKAGAGSRPSTTGRKGSSGGPGSGTFHVPAMGTYRYTTLITDTSPSGAPTSSQSSTSTAEMLRVGSEVGVAWTGFGASLVQSDLYRYAPSEVVETSMEFLNPSGTAVSTACIWSPPLVVYEAPFIPGHSWSAGSSCNFSASGAAVSERMVEQVHVVKRENVSVPGGTFSAVLVDMTEVTTTSSGTASHTDRTSMAMLVDPSTDMLIREVAFDASTGTTMTARLAGFVPETSSSSGSG